MLFDISNAHAEDVNCLDLSDSIFVTGSYDKIYKIWSLVPFVQKPNVLHEVEINDIIWSTELSPTTTRAAVGSAGYVKNETLHIIDLEK